MDSLSYKYYPGTNQLSQVRDGVAKTDYRLPGYEDIDDQDTSNYRYDPIGNLITDASENITNISWNVYGKIIQVNYSNTDNSSLKNLYYFYDAAGNRICKRVEKYNSSGVINSTYTWYVRDASGNVMATYRSTANGGSNPTNLTVTERHLYGSSRLGMLTVTKDVRAAVPSYAINTPYKSALARGFKYYELSNHLGNVLVTITDKKYGHANGNAFDYYDADLEWSTDYYPFGATMQNRSGGVAYRYGFNGKEKDKDGDGGSLQIDYGNRIYDPHLGRFKSVDQLTKDYPELTPYQFASNIPILGIDRDGKEFQINNWIWNIWLDWKFGDPTGIKTLKQGYEEKAAIESYQMSYHNDNVPPQLQNKLDHINNVQANLKIAAGTAKVTTFNIETSFNITSSIIPLGELGVVAKGLKYREGNAIISRAVNDGVEVIIAKTADDLQYLESMNSKALYMGGKGKTGSILITEDAPRSHILEEAIHHEQRIKYGDTYFYSNRNLLEVEAQNKLLRIGAKEGWSKTELAEIRIAKSSWEKALKAQSKRK